MKLKSTFIWLSCLMIIQNAFSFRYDAKEIKPYFSIGGEYRNMKTADIDRMIFKDQGVYYMTQIWEKAKLVDSEGIVTVDNLNSHFKPFGSEDELINVDLGIIGFGGDSRREVISFGGEAGVFYRGMQVGFGVQILQRQISEPRQNTWSCTNCVLQATDTEDENSYVGGASTRLWKTSYQINDYEFVVGYELFPDGFWLQIIPRMGLGWSVYNFQFPGAFGFYTEDGTASTKPFLLEQADYTNVGMSWKFETEFRWTFFDRLGFGAYAGYRFSNFDQVFLGQDESGLDWYYGNSDMDADNLYLGGKILIKLPSFYESEAGKPIR